MTTTKDKEKQNHSCEEPKEKLLKFDKPFTISKEILATPLGQAIVWLMNDVEVPFPELIKPFHTAIFQQFQSEFIIELLWVLKDVSKAWKRTDYPFNTDVCRALESRGFEALQLLNLCEQCEEFDPSFIFPLQSWMLAKAEYKISTLRKYFSKGCDRQSCIQSNRDVLQELRLWKNPYRSESDPSIPKQNWCFRYYPFESAIAIGKPLSGDSKSKYAERKMFQDKAWKPYLNALSAMNRDQLNGVGDIDFCSFEIKGDRVLVKLGGRKRAVGFAPQEKNISGRGRKRTQNQNNPYAESNPALLNQVLTVL